MARMYGRKWAAARAEYLSDNPFCVFCEGEQRMTYATVVDHKVPHRGDPVLFWDEGNWQSLCTLHHNAAKQSEEKTGRVRGCDPDGLPLDPNHHWS